MSSSPSIIKEYAASTGASINAVISVMAQLGIPADTIDRQNGLMKFVLSQSRSQIRITAQVFEASLGVTRVMISEIVYNQDFTSQSPFSSALEEYFLMKYHAPKIFAEIDKILGEGKPVAVTGSGFCFVATAVYGDYCHPNVIILRVFRDVILSRSLIGRLFVGAYYKVGPSLAFVPQNSKIAKKLLRRFMDLIAFSLGRYLVFRGLM